MAIGTYAQLKTAVETWTERSGDAAITANVADFITLAEARLADVLPVRTAEADTTLTGSTSSRSLTLPSDFVEPISLHLTTVTTERRLLRPYVAGTLSLATSNGTPTAWAINGAAIELDVPCDQAHTFSLRYRQKFALSDSATTNWLLTNYPDIYIAATLTEFALFLPDLDMAALWQARLDKRVAEASAIMSRNKPSVLTVDAALIGVGRYDWATDS